VCTVSESMLYYQQGSVGESPWRHIIARESILACKWIDVCWRRTKMISSRKDVLCMFCLFVGNTC